LKSLDTFLEDGMKLDITGLIQEKLFALHYAMIQTEGSFLSLLAMKSKKQNFSTWNPSIKLPPHPKYTRSYSREWRWCLSSSCGIHCSFQSCEQFPSQEHPTQTTWSAVLQ